MIAEAAYFRAERRGFQGGCPMEDWLEAEHEISQLYFQPGNRPAEHWCSWMLWPSSRRRSSSLSARLPTTSHEAGNPPAGA
ncbi:MAG: DUF2934 domain-containing protein [Candidatus Competibacteraceae bacterium]